MTDQGMPSFVFFRRRDIELEGGFVLAGTLIADIPKHAKKMKPRQQRMVAAVVQKLTDLVRSGQMPEDAIIYGWPGGQRPENDDEITDNDALMSAWAQERKIITVRVDPRNDGMVRIDSDIARRAGLVKEH